jgi:Asp-tRNA(Asn)/Glu-tRNA(Gln) amidotransferase A subunit family amidase
MSETLVGILERGASISAETYSQAVIKRNELLRRFSELITSYDAVITPATRGIAPRFEDGTGDPIMSTLWTLLGLPAITLPLLTGAEGMPLGVQLVGRPHDDGTLLATAAWLEERHGPFHSASA